MTAIAPEFICAADPTYTIQLTPKLDDFILDPFINNTGYFFWYEQFPDALNPGPPAQVTKLFMQAFGPGWTQYPITH